jgi:hypothetical protein
MELATKTVLVSFAVMRESRSSKRMADMRFQRAADRNAFVGWLRAQHGRSGFADLTNAMKAKTSAHVLLDLTERELDYVKQTIRSAFAPGVFTVSASDPMIPLLIAAREAEQC